MRTTQSAPIIARAAEIAVDVIDRDARTIEVVWTTGATVQRAQWDGWDEIIEYDEELVVSGNNVRLDRLNAGAPFLDTHAGYSLSSVLGSVVPGSVRIEGGKGTAKVQLTSAADAADAVTRILDKSVRFVSVGYRVHEYEVSVREGQRQLWRAVDWEPYEISAVPMPADAGAHIRGEQTQARAFPCIVTRDDAPAVQAALADEENSMADENAAGVETGQTNPAPQPAPQPEPSPAPDNGTDAQRAVAIERQRSSGIMDLCQRHGLAERAGDFIARGLTMDAVRAELLDSLATRSDGYGRRQEPAPAAARSNGERSTEFRSAAIDALLHRAGQRIELSADAREFRGLRLAEIAKMCLGRSGIEARGMYPAEAIGAALQTRAGVGYHSTSDFAAIMAGTMNRSYQSGYEEAPRTFPAWARRITLRDFRPAVTAIGGAMPNLLKVDEAAEFKYGTMGGSQEAIRLETFGRIIAFTRQLMINDSLNELGDLPRRYGASAARLEGDVVYGVLTSNQVMADGVALFHATHGNLGSAATITDASLAAAMLAFATVKDGNGNVTPVTPRYLIVPPGPRQMEAMRVLAPITAGRSADVNVFANSGLQIIVESRLIPASGQHPWYLAADPGEVDTISYAYLEGQEGPYTETREGFEVDGIETKCRLDFNARAMDFRGLYKNPGAAPA